MAGSDAAPLPLAGALLLDGLLLHATADSARPAVTARSPSLARALRPGQRLAAVSFMVLCEFMTASVPGGGGRRITAGGRAAPSLEGYD